MFTYYKSMKAWTPEEIKGFRESKGLYQKDFAALIGVTREYVVYLEGGNRTPSDTLKRLLDCLEAQHTKKKTKRKGA